MLRRRGLLAAGAAWAAGAYAQPLPVVGNASILNLAQLGPPGGVVPGAALDLNFMTGVLDPSITLTRGSVATYFDATGTMQTVTGNAPRFDYDPATLAMRGLFVEETRINGCRNGNGAGAAPGTPGTYPTNWSELNSAGGSIILNVIGSGTESGIPYVDLRFVGTPANTALRMTMGTATEAAAAIGQVWTHAVYLRLVGGSLANIASINVEMVVYDATQTLLNPTGPSFSSVFPTNAPLATQRYANAWPVAVSSGTVASIRPTLVPVIIAAGVPIDFTLRIGGVQLEQGAFATSYIPTTGAAVQRNGEFYDVLSIPWFNPVVGTAMIEFLTYGYCAAAGGYLRFDDGTNSNCFGMAGNSVAPAAIGVGQATGGVVIVASSGVNTSLGVVHRAAANMAVSGDFMSVDGGPPALQGAGAVPIGINRLRIGNWGTGAARVLNGYMRHVRYWPRVLSNGELIGATFHEFPNAELPRQPARR